MTKPGMDAEQMGRIIALAASNNDFMTVDKMTPERVQIWMFGILTEAPEMTFEEAQGAIGYYYARVGNSMKLKDLIETWEMLAGKAQAPSVLAHDVRVARGMGLVSRDWHEKKQLPADVVAKLAEWRAERDAATAELERKIDAAVAGERLQLDVGRRIP